MNDALPYSIAHRSRQLIHMLLFTLLAHHVQGQVITVMEQGELARSIIAPDSTSLNDSLRTIVFDEQLRGYLSYRRDSIITVGDTLIFYAHRGPLFATAARQLSSRARKDAQLPASASSIKAIALKHIESFENSGYPFAEARLTAQVVNDSIIDFDIEVLPGGYVTFDSLAIQSKRPFNRTYMEQYLSIRPGRPYSERTLKRIPRLIEDLPFVRSKQPPQVIFNQDQADVYLSLEDVRANQFDGIVGFQPDVETGRPVLTGDLSMELHNAFRRGEQIEFQWRRLQEQTQSLRIQTALPYLVNTRLGVWAGADLYRRDSTFTISELDFAVGYLLGADRYLRTFIEQWSSNALRPGLTSIDNVSIRRYGLATQAYRFDYRLNPMKGYSLHTEISAGMKDLVLGDDDPVTTRHNQYSGTLRASLWVPLAGRLSAVVRANAGFKADSTLRFNEFYRIGGLNSLRGFDEESIFARNYAIGTLELKYLLDRSSAVFLFIDQGYYDRTDEGFFSDNPTGFGLGALIGTDNSTFRIYYALGREQNNPILVRNGKVHFGFINRF